MLEKMGILAKDEEFQEYKKFKRWALEEKQYLSLDKLIIDTDLITNIKENFIILTMRNNQNAFYWQLEYLGIFKFFKNNCVVLEPQGPETKTEWLILNENCFTNETIYIIGDSETDLNMIKASYTLKDKIIKVFLVKSGLSNPYKIIDKTKLPAEVIENVNSFLIG